MLVWSFKWNKILNVIKGFTVSHVPIIIEMVEKKLMAQFISRNVVKSNKN